MKKLIALALAVILVMLGSAALAETGIAVNGTGEIRISADTAVISLGVTARNRDVLKAQQRVNETVAAIRKALIELEQTRRALEEDEDAVKNEVRAGYRDLVAARALYENKVEAFKVAQKRVESNDLFMQSGRSSMRDILEAESALLTAQNALCSAVVEWRTSELSLRSAMGILAINDDGTWR